MTTRSAASRRLQDLRDALTTIPNSSTWRRCALVYVAFLACAFPAGMLSGLLRPGFSTLTPAGMIGSGALLFVQPALVEEIVFRGLLLPRDHRSLSRRRLVAVAFVALVLYVVSHPINARLFRPQVLGLFESPAYLAITTLLGLACTASYLISRSIWPPVVLHWLTVVMWIWFLGGQQLLR